MQYIALKSDEQGRHSFLTIVLLTKICFLKIFIPVLNKETFNLIARKPMSSKFKLFINSCLFHMTLSDTWNINLEIYLSIFLKLKLKYSTFSNFRRTKQFYLMKSIPTKFKLCMNSIWFHMTSSDTIILDIFFIHFI